MMWHLFFVSTLVLAAMGRIEFAFVANLVLALAVYTPLASRAQRRARAAVLVPLALVLAWQEFGAPDPTRLVAAAQSLSGFSGAYLGELGGRLATDPALLRVMLVASCSLAIARWVRLDSLVILTLIVFALVVRYVEPRHLAVQEAAQHAGGTQAEVHGASEFDADPQRALEDFWARQAGRQVDFKGGPRPTFDIAFLQVCSLAWDDLRAAGRLDAALLQRFDLVFDHFNSVTSYSGPAALRLLRSPCGQVPHDALYRPGDTECNLPFQLRDAGFDVQLLLNHDGKFERFADLLAAETRRTVVTPRRLSADISVPVRAFDDSPVYDDGELLLDWWQRAGGGAVTAARGARALYYNTVTLHDGNRIAEATAGAAAGAGTSAPGEIASYQWRVDRLFSGIGRLIDEAQAGERPLVLVLVPEHGAALGGVRQQISGLRETPWPEIVQVPVAVKLIGFGPRAQGAAPVHVSAPTSYLSLAALVASLVKGEGWRAIDEAPQRVPTVEPVADNGPAQVVTGERSLWARGAGGRWTAAPLPSSAAGARFAPAPVAVVDAVADTASDAKGTR